ncbi:DNA-directed DNA polymerase II small subunit [Candidatus Woesearchaeota archaeon]|nr:DNA-directed DNA polymerase II small subunit [Candidatus Woesearchaeota archaeon]
MQQELLKKKREIIDIFLKQGILISTELLSQIDDQEYITKIFIALKKKNINEPVLDLNRLIEEAESKNIEDTKGYEEQGRAKVKILSSYKETPKKRDPQDFVDYFNIRYKTIEKILKQHQELVNLVSINKLINKQEKESFPIIGIVNVKQVTKNGNLLLLLEDPTGQIKVLVNKNKPSLFENAKDIVLDEVIGVVGVKVGDFIFANNIIWPDVQVNKELKKSNYEKYVLFLSDLHVGSSKFLHEDFERFLKWINGEVGNEAQRHIAKNIEYIFIAGDLVDGCGVYPEQDKELSTKDIYEQYKQCADILKHIPQHIPLIICPGNHDALRISEPQPPLSKDFAKPMYELNNVVMVSNPAMVNIHSSVDFPGFDVLMYHGYSFDYFIGEVGSLRNQGGYDRADLIMKFLLKKRHLAPTHLSTLYIPDNKKDSLVIDNVPDFFLSGHIHKCATTNYRNVTLICGSCWQSKTIFQEKVGHNPEPSRVPIVNLQTRDLRILKFSH